MTPVAPLILASGSTVRRQLLAAAGVLFSVVPSTVDEAEMRADLGTERGGVDPAYVAGVLARAKAVEVSHRHRDAVVIGADQVLALGDCLFEKPADLSDARNHLYRLRGRTHELYSAIVIAKNGKSIWGTTETAHMTMRALSDHALDAYISQAGERICACVGAYEFEGLGLQLFEKIDGDYFTILGLPMLGLLAQLRALGVIAP